MNLPFIPQVEPYVTEAEAEAAARYLRSGGWLTEFEETRRFAAELAAAVGAAHCEIVSSGTAGLYLALLAAGIGPGQSVVVPDFTMIATANAVRWTGADVLLADVERETLCLDLRTVRLRPDTRALIHVSLNGRAGDLRGVVQFCREHNLLLIEDACQALGSRHDGQWLGTFGDLGVYSFTPHKIITTGQGGAVVTNRPELAAQVRGLKDFCRTAPGVDQHTGIGFNFKFTDLQAVVGREQLRTLEFRRQRRRVLWARYWTELSDLPGIEFVPTDLTETVPWFADLLVLGAGERDRLIAKLRERGIGSRPFYPPLHSQPPYRTCADEAGGAARFPVAEEIARSGLWLPSSIGLADADAARVVSAVREALGVRSALDAAA